MVTLLIPPGVFDALHGRKNLMKAREWFKSLDNETLLDWFFQYGQARQAWGYRNTARRAGVTEVIRRFGACPTDPRVTVIARGAAPGTYTWETR